MECSSARELLHDLRRGRLEPGRAAQVRAHLEACTGCRREEDAEAALDAALVERLPRHPAPPALRRRVEGMVAASRAAPPPPRRASRAQRFLVPIAAVALAVLSAGLLVERQVRSGQQDADRVADEVVTDHLRLLVSQHPNDLESGVNHEVKPWFEGRLDFAPVVPGDRGELHLRGGGVGYVFDRKAAVMSYTLGRHRVTLLAFPGDGITWPAANRSAGGVPAYAASRRGFGVVLWRAGPLAYALVSDVATPDLRALAAQLAPETQG